LVADTAGSLGTAHLAVQAAAEVPIMNVAAALVLWVALGHLVKVIAVVKEYYIIAHLLAGAVAQTLLVGVELLLVRGVTIIVPQEAGGLAKHHQSLVLL
jgi:hypothetical protein